MASSVIDENYPVSYDLERRPQVFPNKPMKLPVYMDYHATTPVDPRVLDAMLPFYRESFGNASSTSHSFGWEAKKAVDAARDRVAALIGAGTDEIFFTSGATESNNLALKGVFELSGGKIHIITQQTEHKSVLSVCRYLEKKNCRITYLPVDSYGRVSTAELENSITDDTALISIMFASNEVGTIQPIGEIGRIAKSRRILFHVDSAQAAGKLPVDVEQLGIDLLSFTAHKMYGPKGIGSLYVRKKNPRVRLAPLFHGGEHEDGLRSGTLNVPAIAGFGSACEIAASEIKEESVRLKDLRGCLLALLEASVGGDSMRLNGHSEERLPGNLNVSFKGVEAEPLLMAVNQKLAVSTSSACTSRNTDPSYVLKAMKVPKEYMHGAIRFGLGRFTTREEVEWAAGYIGDAVKTLRELSPFYNGES